MRAKEFIIERSFPKGEWVELTPTDKAESADEIVDLVKNAYKKTSFGSYVNDQNDVQSSEWLALDWDDQDDLDAVIFYRLPRPSESWKGFKLQGLGQDGQPVSKKKVISKICSVLNRSGWWIESSDSLRSVLLAAGSAPVVSDVKVLRRLFSDPNLRMVNNTSYVRTLANGTVVTETVFGRPVIE